MEWGNITEREFLIAELLRFKEENNRMPQARDMCECKGYPSCKKYIAEFGSWKIATDITFLNRNENRTEEEFLIDSLLRFVEEDNRIPGKRDMVNYNGYPNERRYRIAFGSWENALDELFPDRNYIMDYFVPEEMDLKKWYIVGYTIAEGCVYDNILVIGTSEKDKDNLYKIHEYMNTKTNISIIDHEKKQKAYRIGLRCQKWVDDLKLYGVVPKKSKITYIPLDYLETPEEEAAICRGIFDGDGCIRPLSKDSFLPEFSIVGSKQLCEDYAYLLDYNCDIDCNVTTNKGSFRIRIKNIEKCQKIYDFLYGHDNFYIRRKKERFEKLLNGTFTKETDPYYVN